MSLAIAYTIDKSGDVQVIPETLVAGMLCCDSQGIVQFANAEAQHLLAMSAGELVDARLEDLLPGVSPSVWRDASCGSFSFPSVTASDKAIQIECELTILPPGSVPAFIVSLRPSRPNLRIVGDDDIDIAHHFPLEPQPRQPDDFASLAYSIVDSVDEVVWSMEPESRSFIFLNPAAEKLFQVPVDELVRTPSKWIEHVHYDDRKSLVESLDLLFDFGSLECQVRVARPDQSECWIEIKAHAIYDEAGEIIRADGIITDITERKQHDVHVGRLNAHLRHRIDRITALHQIDSAISSNQDLTITLGVCLDHVTSLLEVDAARVLLFDPLSMRLKFAAGKGFRNGNGRDTQRLIGTLQASKAATGRCTIFIPDIRWGSSTIPPSAALDEQQFVSYLSIPLIAHGQVNGILEVLHRSHLEPDNEWRDFLNAVSDQAAIAIDNASTLARLQQANQELSVAYDETIEGWSRALDLRDKETEGHSRRVTEMTMRLAKQLGIGDVELVQVRRGALLHDIGKMGVPDPILLKPGPLDDAEWVIMRKHPTYALEMLSPIEFLRGAMDIPYCHHEKWDGTGYPRGLKGTQIPLSARIFAIIDVWDALRSDRPYRKAWSVEKVINHIHSLSGSHFDPRVVNVFLKMITEECADGLTGDDDGF